jgi:hypothetical protein
MVNTRNFIRVIARWLPGFIDTDVNIIITLLVLLLIIGALIENDIILIVTASGIFGVIVVQAARNYKKGHVLYCGRVLQL